jgi:hypothetical protein
MEAAARLIESSRLEGDLVGLRLERPAGYECHAGPFCFLTLPDLGFHDEAGPRMHLSLASSGGGSRVPIRVQGCW